MDTMLYNVQEATVHQAVVVLPSLSISGVTSCKLMEVEAEIEETVEVAATGEPVSRV